MSLSLSRIPKKVGRGDSITAEEHNALVDFLHDLYAEIKSTTLCSSADISAQKSPAGTYAVIKRRSASPAGDSPPCIFGELETWTPSGSDIPVTGITGGIVCCADKNLTVEHLKIDVSGADSEQLFFLTIECTANTDDAGEIILPGLESCATTADGAWGAPIPWTEGAQYPDNSNPTASSPAGSITIPIGRVSIKNHAATLAPAGCGNVTVSQCAATLTHTRG